MELRLWGYVYAHIDEIAVYVFIIISLYWLLGQFSKNKFKQLRLQRMGVWRLTRLVGYITYIENKSSFYSSSKGKDNFLAYLYIKKIWWLPKWIGMWMSHHCAKKGYTDAQTEKIILVKQDKYRVGKSILVMNKKILFWNTEKDRYELLERMPITYDVGPEHLETWTEKQIELIDAKSTKGARSSPSVVHNQLRIHSIPLDPGTYEERKQPRAVLDDEHIITKKGEYKKHVPSLKSRGSKAYIEGELR